MTGKIRFVIQKTKAKARNAIDCFEPSTDSFRSIFVVLGINFLQSYNSGDQGSCIASGSLALSCCAELLQNDGNHYWGWLFSLNRAEHFNIQQSVLSRIVTEEYSTQ
jgi:hypothetical protein